VSCFFLRHSVYMYIYIYIFSATFYTPALAEFVILQPPRVGGVKVYIDNIRRNEVIMDMEIV